MGYLVGFQGSEAIDDRPVGAQEEAARAARRVADAIAGLGLHHVNDR